MEKRGTKGLKRLRADSKATKPTYECPHCKCKRYSPCKCAKSQEVVTENKQP